MVSALIVVQIVLLAATVGAFAFMLSSLWATLKITFVGVPESALRGTKRRRPLTSTPSAMSAPSDSPRQVPRTPYTRSSQKSTSTQLGE